MRSFAPPHSSCSNPITGTHSVIGKRRGWHYRTAVLVSQRRLYAAFRRHNVSDGIASIATPLPEHMHTRFRACYSYAGKTRQSDDATRAPQKWPEMGKRCNWSSSSALKKPPHVARKGKVFDFYHFGPYLLSLRRSRVSPMAWLFLTLLEMTFVNGGTCSSATLLGRITKTNT